jgi:hypothetical protein
VTVVTCDDALPDDEPGTVTVRGWGNGPLTLVDVVAGLDGEDEYDPAEPVAGDP